MSAPTLKAVILQAFTEGYVNGVNHTRGRSVVLESMRIGEAFWSRVRDEAEREFPAASSSSTPLSETQTTSQSTPRSSQTGSSAEPTSEGT